MRHCRLQLPRSCGPRWPQRRIAFYFFASFLKFTRVGGHLLPSRIPMRRALSVALTCSALLLLLIHYSQPPAHTPHASPPTLLFSPPPSPLLHSPPPPLIMSHLRPAAGTVRNSNNLARPPHHRRIAPTNLSARRRSKSLWHGGFDGRLPLSSCQWKALPPPCQMQGDPSELPTIQRYYRLGHAPRAITNPDVEICLHQGASPLASRLNIIRSANFAMIGNKRVNKPEGVPRMVLAAQCPVSPLSLAIRGGLRLQASLRTDIGPSQTPQFKPTARLELAAATRRLARHMHRPRFTVHSRPRNGERATRGLRCSPSSIHRTLTRPSSLAAAAHASQRHGRFSLETHPRLSPTRAINSLSTLSTSMGTAALDG